VQPAKELTQASKRLNRNCFCITLDQEALCRALEREAGDPAFCHDHVRTRQNLFSNVPLFLPKSSIAEMQGVVAAIHSISEMPAYQTRVLSWAPDIARKDFGPSGAFMGYDFHLADDGARLIEVNTNAGGAFLNALLATAQLACCTEMENAPNLPNAGNFNADVVEIFEEEWRLQRINGPCDASLSWMMRHSHSIFIQNLFWLGRRCSRPVMMPSSQGRMSFALKTATDFEGRASTWFIIASSISPLSCQSTPLWSAYESGMIAVTPNPRNMNCR
jgi:hypothetical protein